MYEYDVYYNGRKIDTIYYIYDLSPSEVKKDLVEHDGYPELIIVSKYIRTEKV